MANGKRQTADGVNPPESPFSPEYSGRGKGDLVELKVNACVECGRTDDIHVGQTSVGCHSCNRFTVCTDTECAVAVWNLQNPLVKSATHNGLAISEQDKRNYYKAQGKL